MNKKSKKNPDPNEDIVRFRNLDPYETLINSDLVLKQKESTI